MENAASIVIDRPIDRVFQMTADRVADWSHIVVEDEVIDEQPDGVGTTFRTVTEERGKRMEFQGVVTGYDPPRLHRVEMTGDSFDIDSEFVFEELDGGRQTRVSQRASVAGKGFFKIFLFLFGWMMKKSHCDASQKELESLKAFCEKEIPTGEE